MSSKTYKRKNTKSKNKKKDIKTLKKINIKRNNRRSKIRSNIRKIRGGGVVSIKWDHRTGFVDNIDFDNFDTKNLKNKEILFQIQDDVTISSINASITKQDTKFTKATIIPGKIIIAEINPTYLLLVIKFELGIRINRTEPFHVCINNNNNNNNNNCINHLSMFEIIEEETIQKTPTQSHAGQKKMYLPSPSPSNIYINPNKQPNKQPNNNNNNNFNINLTQFNPKEDYYTGYVENE